MGAKGELSGWERGRWRVAASIPRTSCPWHLCWASLLTLSLLLYILAVYGASCSPPARATEDEPRGSSMSGNLLFRMRQNLPYQTSERWAGDLRDLVASWNRLRYAATPPEKLRIALFVKKWPVGGTPGGLERHAMTLHGALAERGHMAHVYTMSGDGTRPQDSRDGNLHVHFVDPGVGGSFQFSEAWEQFVRDNATQPFDVVHTESVALPHWRAKDVPNLAASWHGIAFEVIHSDIVHDLIRKPGEPRSLDLQKTLSERLGRVADEVRFFHSYKQHVATSDYVGDVLRTVYELPDQNVHTILNGVDEHKFRPDSQAGALFRARYGVPGNASLVLGAAGRLVRDKGHPLLFEAFREVLKERRDVYLLVAGTGPWADRYKELAPNAKILGAMTPIQLGQFYNALDIFVNPTLRSQGLDHTLLEAMLCGKPLMATKFSSITWSVVTSDEFGYTFSPNAGALTQMLRRVIRDGREVMRLKGRPVSNRPPSCSLPPKWPPPTNVFFCV